MVPAPMLIGAGFALGPPAGWTADPAVLLWGGAAALVQLRARRRVAPAVRGREPAFWAGLAVLVVALASPLETAAHELFAFHMVQHLLIGLVAPLLFVCARPLRGWSHLLAPPLRLRLLRGGARLARRWGVHRDRAGPALLVTAGHVAVTAVWHVPALYDAAVRHPAVHLIEHASFFVGGVALWWCVLAAGGHARRGLAVLVLFLSGLGTGAVAALLTLTPRPLYTAHLATAAHWGLQPLEDQQLAGAIMWVPGGLIYLLAAAGLLVRWLDTDPARPSSPWEVHP